MVDRQGNLREQTVDQQQKVAERLNRRSKLAPILQSVQEDLPERSTPDQDPRFQRIEQDLDNFKPNRLQSGNQLSNNNPSPAAQQILLQQQRRQAPSQNQQPRVIQSPTEQARLRAYKQSLNLQSSVSPNGASEGGLDRKIPSPQVRRINGNSQASLGQARTPSQQEIRLQSTVVPRNEYSALVPREASNSAQATGFVNQGANSVDVAAVGNQGDQKGPLKRGKTRVDFVDGNIRVETEELVKQTEALVQRPPSSSPEPRQQLHGQKASVGTSFKTDESLKSYNQDQSRSLTSAPQYLQQRRRHSPPSDGVSVSVIPTPPPAGQYPLQYQQRTGPQQIGQKLDEQVRNAENAKPPGFQNNNGDARQPWNDNPRQDNTDKKHDSGTQKKPVVLSTVQTNEHGILQKQDQIISEQTVLDGPIVHKDQTQAPKVIRNEQGKFVRLDHARSVPAIRPKPQAALVQTQGEESFQEGPLRETDKHVVAQRPQRRPPIVQPANVLRALQKKSTQINQLNQRIEDQNNQLFIAQRELEFKQNEMIRQQHLHTMSQQLMTSLSKMPLQQPQIVIQQQPQAQPQLIQVPPVAASQTIIQQQQQELPVQPLLAPQPVLMPQPEVGLNQTGNQRLEKANLDRIPALANDIASVPLGGPLSEDQLSTTSNLKWEMATQTDPVQIVDPRNPVPQPSSVADLVNDLQQKQKGLDVHALTLKQVEIKENTLRSEFKLVQKGMQDQIEALQNKVETMKVESQDQAKQIRELEEIRRRQERQINQANSEAKAAQEKVEYTEKLLEEAKLEIEIKTKEAQARLRSQDEQDKEIAAFQREIAMKEIEIKLHDSKMRQLKDDNTKVRMQLRDPSNIRRNQPGMSEPIQAVGILDEFDRVQKQYDMLTLQEELKQIIVENSLLKEKVTDLQDRFKRIEQKRDQFIKELEDKIAAQELEASKNEGRGKSIKQLQRQLKDIEGQNQTLKTQIEFLTGQNRQKDVDQDRVVQGLRQRIYKLEEQVSKKDSQLQIQDAELEIYDRESGKDPSQRRPQRLLSSTKRSPSQASNSPPRRGYSQRLRNSVQDIRREARSESESLQEQETLSKRNAQSATRYRGVNQQAGSNIGGGVRNLVNQQQVSPKISKQAVNRQKQPLQQQSQSTPNLPTAQQTEPDFGQFTFSENHANSPFAEVAASQAQPATQKQQYYQDDGSDLDGGQGYALQNDAQLLNQVEVRYPYSRGQNGQGAF